MAQGARGPRGPRGGHWGVTGGLVGATTPRDIEFGAASESQLLSAARSPERPPCQVLPFLYEQGCHWLLLAFGFPINRRRLFLCSVFNRYWGEKQCSVSHLTHGAISSLCRNNLFIVM